MTEAVGVVTDTDSLSMEYTRWAGTEGREPMCRICPPAVAAGCISGVGSCIAGELAGTAAVVAGMRLSQWSRLELVGMEEVVDRRLRDSCRGRLGGS